MGYTRIDASPASEELHTIRGFKKGNLSRVEMLKGEKKVEMAFEVLEISR